MCDKERLIDVMHGLMLSENLGDVHDQIFRLADAIGVPRPEGDFFDGWEAFKHDTE
jgi:hypothetical protein